MCLQKKCYIYSTFIESPANQAHYQLTDHLGNVRAVVARAGGSPQINGATDYYPFGSPMPGRSIVGGYRYAYQGQEKDAETGKEAFELRLWDARIGRWLTTDPYSQHASPYLGMGNNPIRNIDPDGGYCQDAKGNTIPCEGVFGGENFNGPTNETLTQLDEVVVVWSKESNSIVNSNAWRLPFGTEIGVAGSAASIGKNFIYNNDFWLGRNGKFYEQSFNGNQYTGGKHKFARNLGKTAGRVGSVAGVYSAFATERAFANGEITEGRRNVDQTVNGIGFLGPYGATFSLGFNLGYLIEDACNCNIQLNPNTFKEGYWERRSLTIHNLFSDKYVPEESIFLK